MTKTKSKAKAKAKIEAETYPCSLCSEKNPKNGQKQRTTNELERHQKSFHEADKICTRKGCFIIYSSNTHHRHRKIVETEAAATEAAEYAEVVEAAAENAYAVTEAEMKKMGYN